MTGQGILRSAVAFLVLGLACIGASSSCPPARGSCSAAGPGGAVSARRDRPGRSDRPEFTWNRCNDWKPGERNGSSAGNPGRDNAGRAVWSYEHIDDVPLESGLDTARPWYKRPSSGAMVWDGKVCGGRWTYRHDAVDAARGAIAQVCADPSRPGERTSNVDLVRWKNPLIFPAKVTIRSGEGFTAKIGEGLPTGSVIDVAVAWTDHSNGGAAHVLYGKTLVKTAEPEAGQYFKLPALVVKNLSLDPGDDILFSVRSRTRVVGDKRRLAVAFYDDVTIAATPVVVRRYKPGFIWKRRADWRPGKADRQQTGNPGLDAAGAPVWNYEYILNVPAGSELGSKHPWYERPSCGHMVWDSHWSGGTWARKYDCPPTALRILLGHITTDKSYFGNAYPNVPLLRWRNPSAKPLAVSLRSGDDLKCQMDIGMPTGTTVDVVIARTDASDGGAVHVIYSATACKQMAANRRERQVLPPVSIDRLVLDPGDDLLFSVRSRTRTTGFEALNVGFLDDVTITVLPSRGRTYKQGFRWNPQADWKPGKADGKQAGNPCTDSAGTAVWSYQYIDNVPADSGLNSKCPWYNLRPSGQMVWDGHSGPKGAWAYQYDTPPFIFAPPFGPRHVAKNESYRGDHFARVPVLQWINPMSRPIAVSLASGPGFKGHIYKLPTGTTADIVVARTDASAGGAVHVLYSHTMVKTRPEQESQDFELPPLAIDKLQLDPGDDILLTTRARTSSTGYTWYSAGFDDDINIKVLPTSSSR